MELYTSPKYEIKNQRDQRNCKTILVVGETGAGKTTMLNAMLNYCEGVRYNDTFRYELVDERKLREKGYGDAKSLTQEVTIYTIYCKATKQYIKVLDTPGFKDVEGLAKDD